MSQDDPPETYGFDEHQAFLLTTFGPDLVPDATQIARQNTGDAQLDLSMEIEQLFWDCCDDMGDDTRDAITQLLDDSDDEQVLCAVASLRASRG